MVPSTPSEMQLLSLYESWAATPDNGTKQYALALDIATNGEENVSYRPEFAGWLIQDHLDKQHPMDVLVWRAWVLWWTRAEQLQGWASKYQYHWAGLLETLLCSAKANAWNKAWHWALDEHPDQVGLYKEKAQKSYEEAMMALNKERHPVRTIIQIALKDEPWYTTLNESNVITI